MGHPHPQGASREVRVALTKTAAAKASNTFLFLFFLPLRINNSLGTQTQPKVGTCVVRTALPSSVLPCGACPDTAWTHKHTALPQFFSSSFFNPDQNNNSCSGSSSPLANMLQPRPCSFSFYPTDGMRKKHNNHQDRKQSHCRSFFSSSECSFPALFIDECEYINFSKYLERTNPIQAGAAVWTNTKAAEGGWNFYNG